MVHLSHSIMFHFHTARTNLCHVVSFSFFKNPVLRIWHICNPLQLCLLESWNLVDSSGVDASRIHLRFSFSQVPKNMASSSWIHSAFFRDYPHRQCNDENTMHAELILTCVASPIALHTAKLLYEIVNYHYSIILF